MTGLGFISLQGRVSFGAHIPSPCSQWFFCGRQSRQSKMAGRAVCRYVAFTQCNHDFQAKEASRRIGVFLSSSGSSCGLAAEASPPTTPAPSDAVSFSSPSLLPFHTPGVTQDPRAETHTRGGQLKSPKATLRSLSRGQLLLRPVTPLVLRSCAPSRQETLLVPTGTWVSTVPLLCLSVGNRRMCRHHSFL